MQRVIRQRMYQRTRQMMAGRSQQQRAAICFAFGDVRRGDGASSPRFVQNDKRRVDIMTVLLRQETCQGILCRTGRIRDHPSENL